MGLLDQASHHTDQADLIILAHVETIRDQVQPATPSAVASLIGGAPVRDIRLRMIKLTRLGALEVIPGPSRVHPGAQLTEMGCELLRRDLIGWTPSEREEGRRYSQLLLAASRPRTRWS